MGKLNKPTLHMTGIPGWLQPQKQDSGNFHTEATLEKALTLLEGGMSIAQICREERDMPSPHYLYKWFRQTQEWHDRYLEARKMGAEMLADEILDISDGTLENGEEAMEDVQRSQLRIKARQWYVSKLDPDRFGEKKKVEIEDNINLTVAIEEGLKRVNNRVIEGESRRLVNE